MLEQSDGPSTDAEDTIAMFLESKAGWRKKPTTALRQEKQLRKVFAQVAENTGDNTLTPSKILRTCLDDVEKILLGQVKNHSASVKSVVIALLEFHRYVSVREPEHSVQWDASRRRLETWKRDACSADLHREAALQDMMAEDGYLPSLAELNDFRRRVTEELESSKKDRKEIKRSDAVRMRRLLTSALLLQNFQRAGTIKNATLAEYKGIKDAVMRVKEHKSHASYGSANIVVQGYENHLREFVDKYRPLLVKQQDDVSLFPSSDPADDIGAVCDSYAIQRINPTKLRKTASTAAYDHLSETERRKLASHMTHKPETQFRAYSAKNRRNDATKTVQRMGEVVYGIGSEAASTTPSSAGALQRQSFSAEALSLIEKEVRRLVRSGQFVTHNRAMMLMAKHVPIFDCHSPKTVENKLRELLRRARVSSGRSTRRAV